MSFFVANFGCRTAQSEGAAIEQELRAAAGDAAATPAATPYEAQVVVVNSCTVTEEADREVRQLIRRIAARNPSARIVVTGCYAQRAPEEVAALPHVRFVAGNSHKPLVGALALQAMEEGPQPAGRAEIFCSDIFSERELAPSEHLGSGGRTRAVVKVQDGCNANCSFCVIPAVRGRSRSLQADSVMAEVRSLVARGYKELVFSGIHLGSYGRDLQSRVSLAGLIEDVLAGAPRLERLRLSSIEPLEVTPEIVRLVSENPRLARHLHIPLQSGSRRILREMRRPYTPEYYLELTERIRDSVEDAAIGADVMVGFPGETDDEFLETCRLIGRSPLTYLHVFPYSSRPGTAAAELPNPVPAHIAQFRAKTLRRIIAEKNEAFRRRMIGRKLDALVLQPGEALSSNFIKIEAPAAAPVNEWVEMRIAALAGAGLRAG